MMSTSLFKTFFYSSVLFVFTACAGSGGGDVESLLDKGPEPTPQTSRIPKVCSTLNFDNVVWPSDFNENDQQAFALAMNITGSFEGHAGWTNLSNNFDGQGVSMGILNQNLGQGTLQPLFLNMRDNNLPILKKHLSSSMLKSLLGMLSSWEKSQTNLRSLAVAQPFNFERAPLDEFSLEGDIDKAYGVSAIQLQSNSKSVSWAKKTLYSDRNARNFKSSWRKALKAIAAEPSYVSLQIEAARYIHDRTHNYKHRLEWNQIRSYLFLFDIVVQNGSLKEKHFDKFSRWLKRQNGATEEEQMLEMLEIRVVDSNPRWQKDVRLRKTAVIKGVGRVHGENRNLPVEYCYDPIIGYDSPEPVPEQP